jgi:hypothetical protein
MRTLSVWLFNCDRNTCAHIFLLKGVYLSLAGAPTA